MLEQELTESIGITESYISTLNDMMGAINILWMVKQDVGNLPDSSNMTEEEIA